MDDPYFVADRPSDKVKGVCRPKRRWLVQAAITLAMGLPVWACAFYPIVTSENFGKPLGEGMPSTLPDEANRVRNAAGFSLVLPPHWELSIEHSKGLGRIGGWPRDLIPRRSASVINVSKVGPDPPSNLLEYRPTAFQAQPAFEEIEFRPSTWDDPAHFHATIAFTRGGSWYVVTYTGQYGELAIPPMIYRYLSAFRIEPSRDRADEHAVAAPILTPPRVSREIDDRSPGSRTARRRATRPAEEPSREGDE